MDAVPDPAIIAALRAAAQLAPDNAPLRAHVVRALLSSGLASDAEAEARVALSDLPGNPDVLSGLAAAFAAQGRVSEALVTLESIPAPQRDASAHLLLAQMLIASGDLAGASSAYGDARALDPDIHDPALDSLPREPTEPSHETDDVSHNEDERVMVRIGGLDSPNEDAIAPVERPDVTFADVGGLESVKDEIRIKIISPIVHPELFAAYGKTAGGGVLLFGPPGCGKTHLARATAGEIDSAFINVGIDDILDPYLGMSERQLAAVFDTARRHTPCVLFFDEVDALAADRRDLRGSAGRTLINQFLAELDGLQNDNEGLLVLAATNGPWYLDSAFRRPGRFDRQVFVPPPDESARLAILEILLAKRPVSTKLDLAKIASATKDCSGADLREVVDRAIEAKLRDALRTGRPEPIDTRDLLDAAKRTRPSTVEWFASARNYVLHANQSGAYDDIARYLGLD